MCCRVCVVACVVVAHESTHVCELTHGASLFPPPPPPSLLSSPSSPLLQVSEKDSRIIFDRMDTSADGKLTALEFTVGVRRCVGELEAKQAEGIRMKGEEGGHSRLYGDDVAVDPRQEARQRAAVDSATHRLEQRLRQSIAAEPVAASNYLSHIFKRYDGDHDGLVSRAEFKKALGKVRELLHTPHSVMKVVVVVVVVVVVCVFVCVFVCFNVTQFRVSPGGF